MSEIVRVRLPDGQEIWARVTGSAGPSDIGLADKVKARATENINELIGAVAGNLRDALEQYEADEVSADFGIELSAQTGRVIGVLAETGATASLTVHLTWRRPGASAETSA
jgi:hypothetical protein